MEASPLMSITLFEIDEKDFPVGVHVERFGEDELTDNFLLCFDKDFRVTLGQSKNGPVIQLDKRMAESAALKKAVTKLWKEEE